MSAVESLARCSVVFLGTVGYARAWSLQRSIHSQVANGLLPNTLMLLEHPHTYTLGRRGKDNDILASPETLERLGAEVHHVDRGGEVTYHGPGQIVGYPIVDLRSWGGGPLRYVSTLEHTVIATLAELGIDTLSDDRPTGVWVDDAKIAAVGVKIGRGVTMHGFALNVNPDLSYFDHIVPCGMPGGKVTSISSLLGKVVTADHVAPVLARHFGHAFGWTMEWQSREDLSWLAAIEEQAGLDGITV